MTTISVSADLLQVLKHPEVKQYADSLLEIPLGWYSKPELGHRLAGAEKSDRAVAYRLIDALTDSGLMAVIDVWHNTWTLKTVYVDPDALAEFFGGLR